MSKFMQNGKLLTLVMFASLLVLTISFSSAYSAADYYANYEIHTFNPNPNTYQASNYEKTVITEGSFGSTYQHTIKQTEKIERNGYTSSKSYTYSDSAYEPNNHLRRDSYSTISSTSRNSFKVNRNQRIDTRTSGQRDYYSYDYAGYPPSNFRYKQVYNQVQYGKDDYTKPYYYEPRYDSREQHFNWRY